MFGIYETGRRGEGEAVKRLVAAWWAVVIAFMGEGRTTACRGGGVGWREGKREEEDWEDICIYYVPTSTLSGTLSWIVLLNRLELLACGCRVVSCLVIANV